MDAGLGFSYDEIAAETGRRYPVRPREAYRLAWGWTLEQAAVRFNDRAVNADTSEDLDKQREDQALLGIQ